LARESHVLFEEGTAAAFQICDFARDH
jgi:hypothetical protein